MLPWGLFMNPIRITSVGILGLALSGCMTASLVSRTYHPKKGGVVKFMNAGASAVINSRRNDGLRQMREFCVGPFIITEESDSAVSTGAYAQSYGNGVMISNTSTEYTYVHFICDEKSATTPTSSRGAAAL